VGVLNGAGYSFTVTSLKYLKSDPHYKAFLRKINPAAVTAFENLEREGSTAASGPMAAAIAQTGPHMRWTDRCRPIPLKNY